MARIPINIKDGSIKKNPLIIGIDLGTTNSLVALVNQKNKTPYCLSENSNTIVPSVIHINKTGEITVGLSAKNRLETEPENTIYSIKRLLGKSYIDIQAIENSYGFKIQAEDSTSLVRIKINEQLYNPIELSSYILKHLKEKAERICQQTIEKAVITVPAYFNDSQRQATRDAGKLAGLEVVRIVNEPTAASLAYGLGLNKDEQKTIAVYDLGGGTFDVTILNLENGIFEVLSTNGDTFIGGDDFDRALLESLIIQFDLNINEVEKDKELYQHLRLETEKIKIQLTEKETVEFKIQFNGNNYTGKVSKNQFNQCIATIVKKTINCCQQALLDAELTFEQIDEVIMVGGSSRVPLVYEEVSKLFNKSKINKQINPDEVVALGAAIEADILSGNRKDLLLMDVTPLSLGIETSGGLMDVIIPRNSKIPCKAGRQYTTSVDGQINLKIAVYQGERDMVDDNRKLGEFILKNIPAMPAGLPKIDIQFLLNADGILKVAAHELRSDTKQDIEIKPQYGLTDKEVEERLLDSLKNAEFDKENKALQESINEAEQLIYHTEKVISNHQIIDANSVEKIAKQIEKLRETISSKDKEAINLESERLNEYTKPIAEHLMDDAIGKALTGTKINE